MQNRLLKSIVVCVALLSLRTAQASPFMSFGDIAEHSPSNRYKIEALSPDNRPDSGKRFWQSNFTFTCTDTSTGKILWTRKQQEEGGDTPSAMFVSDAGWTVIRTYLDDIICIDREGAVRGTVDLIPDALVGTEFKDYVHWTTAGYAWSSYSLWYFLDAGGRELFVVRPWWGRSIVVDVESGGLAKASPAVARAINAYEHDYVITELAKGVRNRAAWEQEFAGRAAGPVLMAAYLAGVQHVTDAVPDLVKLQDSGYIGSSTGLLDLEKFEAEVDPHDYSTFAMRQVVHLSLRRLGKSPGHSPVHIFSTHYKDKRNTEYEPKPQTMPRHTKSDAVRKGMKAEDVLDLIGAPDFVERDTWEYDMDTEPAHSLIVNWDRRRVLGTEKRVPALWQKGMVRDRQVAE